MLDTLKSMILDFQELSALSEAMRELGCKTGTIVTRGEDERIDTDSGTIDVVPVWRFLLKE